MLKVFAPTIFLSGFAGVLRGYFQAHGSMVQTSFSQIAEQILNAVISICAARALIDTRRPANQTDVNQRAVKNPVRIAIFL